MLVNSHQPHFNSREQLIDILHEENEIQLIHRLDSFLQDNYQWSINESHIQRALCEKAYKIIMDNHLDDQIEIAFYGSLKFKNSEFCEQISIRKIDYESLNFTPIQKQEINIHEEKENFNINKIENFSLNSLKEIIRDRTKSLNHLSVSKTNIAENINLSNVQNLNKDENYVLYDTGKMFALILRNVIPKEIINSFKATKLSTQPWPRGEAGVIWDTYEADHVNIFKELQGDDLENCQPGAYIFPSAKKSFGKKKGKFIEHVIYYLNSNGNKLTTFRVIKAEKAWDSKQIDLSDEQKEILKYVPEKKQSGSFTYEKNKFYFQKTLDKIIIAEINGKESSTMCQKSVQSTAYGSKACTKKKSILLSSKLSKNDQKEEKNKQVCKPYDFQNDEKIHEILKTTNSIFKNLIDQNTDNHLEELLKNHADNAKNLKAWCGPNGFFSNIHVNYTWPETPTTNFHKDTNVAEDGLAALIVTGNQYTGGETVFPELTLNGNPMGVDMREGDLMLFQSKKYLHGNLPVQQTFNYKDEKDCIKHPENRRSIVLYLNDSFNHCEHKESFDTKVLKTINTSAQDNQPASKKRKIELQGL